jgi:hypothetical protein
MYYFTTSTRKKEEGGRKEGRKEGGGRKQENITKIREINIYLIHFNKKTIASLRKLLQSSFALGAKVSL